MRPPGPQTIGRLRPGGAEDQRAEVPYDPGPTKEAIGFRCGLRRRQVPCPVGSMGGTAGVGGFDLVCETRYALIN